jgi:pSer/pThr/pTyr-binding forkhead associated (FHA) protein
MRDGFTVKLPTEAREDRFPEYREQWRAILVILSGGAAGSEFELEESSVTLGREPSGGLRFDDAAMSREHVVFEFVDGGFRVRDLGSMNGTLVNGSEARTAELKNGDRIQIGGHVFQFVLEQRERAPRTYVLPEE